MFTAQSRGFRAAAICGAALFAIPAVALTMSVTTAGAATPTTIDLATASGVSVLAGAGVTNTGPSVLNGDLDTSPTAAITGFPPGIVNGARHATDAVAGQAQASLTTAYNAAVAAPSTSDVTGVDLSGLILTEGVYSASTSMAMNGPLPLTLNGNADAVFIFQAGSTLITGANSSVVLTGGAQACNVFWQVGSSATLGTNTSFIGSILAQTSITLGTGATVDGRALARVGSVTLDTNVFTSSACVPSSAVTPATTVPTTTAPIGATPTTTAPTGTAPAAPTTTAPAVSPTTSPVAAPPAAATPATAPATPLKRTAATATPVVTAAPRATTSTLSRTPTTVSTSSTPGPSLGGSGATPFLPPLVGPPRTGGAPLAVPSRSLPVLPLLALAAAGFAAAAAAALALRSFAGSTARS